MTQPITHGHIATLRRQIYVTGNETNKYLIIIVPFTLHFSISERFPVGFHARKKKSLNLLLLTETRGRKIATFPRRNAVSRCVSKLFVVMHAQCRRGDKLCREYAAKERECNSRAISPRRFGRRRTTVGSSSWIVLYLLWINAWRGRAGAFVNGEAPGNQSPIAVLFVPSDIAIPSSPWGFYFHTVQAPCCNSYAWVVCASPEQVRSCANGAC